MKKIKNVIIILEIIIFISFLSYYLSQNYLSPKAKITQMLSTTGKTMEFKPYTFFIERVDKAGLYNITIGCNVEPKFMTTAKKGIYKVTPYNIEFILYAGYSYNPENNNSRKIPFEQFKLAIPMIHK